MNNSNMENPALGALDQTMHDVERAMEYRERAMEGRERALKDRERALEGEEQALEDEEPAPEPYTGLLVFIACLFAGVMTLSLGAIAGWYLRELRIVPVHLDLYMPVCVNVTTMTYYQATCLLN